MALKWTKRATRNLETILDHIANENKEASHKLAVDWAHQFAQLEAFPLLGRAGPVTKVRELVLHENYIAHYRVKGKTVEIIRVLHTKQQFPFSIQNG